MNTENKDTEQSKYNKFQGILSDAVQIEPNGNQGFAKIGSLCVLLELYYLLPINGEN